MIVCTGCGVEKSEDCFGVDRRRSRLMRRCKECRTSAARAWRKSRPDYEKTRYQALKHVERERHLVRKYGVDLATYADMLKAQNNLCAICAAPESSQHKGVFHIDHCHATGKVRGLLCRGRNHMLGVVGDDPLILARAIRYLERLP
jgi:hypothetical protein